MPAPGYAAGAVTAAAESEVAGKYPGNRMAEGAAGIGPIHDAAGNVTVLEARNLSYDGEGRIVKVAKASGSPAEEWSYGYDGDGRRVRQVHSVGGTVADETHYAYEAGGALLAEYAVTGNTIAAEGLRYVTADWLGSTRLRVTDAAGAVVTRLDYLPFGEVMRGEGTGPRVKFTGKEREDYANLRLDYFGARYMGAVVGKVYEPGCAVQRPASRESAELESIFVHTKQPTGPR